MSHPEVFSGSAANLIPGSHGGGTQSCRVRRCSRGDVVITASSAVATPGAMILARPHPGQSSVIRHVGSTCFREKNIFDDVGTFSSAKFEPARKVGMYHAQQGMNPVGKR